MSAERICLIAGLGNPGPDYEGTRHNVGFDFVEKMLAKLPGNWEKIHAFNSYCWKGTYAGQKLILQTPLTFMNLSGNAVAGLARAEKIAPEQIMIVHDDMDLEPGRIRLRANGSSGGHNGIKSVIEQLGTQNFSRLRIGIGKMANGHGSADFVLSKFQPEEQALMDQVLAMAVDAAILAMRRSLQMAMAQYNNKLLSIENKTEDNTLK
ncbi:MAG: aminoacyl-tRNA hydrolase [Lentisphaerae bacterium]|nr:aminoacyl-tRNA hydrolase [Lentisphaerota bacterium]